MVTATIMLGAGFDGVRNHESSELAQLQLSMDAVGQTTHHVLATIKLDASITGQASFFVSAEIKLHASTMVDRNTEVTRDINLVLSAPTEATRHTIVTVDEALLHLSAIATPERIFKAVAALKPKASLVVDYQLVAVARVPQQSGPPLLIEVDPIEWTGLSYTDELNKAQQLAAGCQISSLTEPVLQRLRDLENNPTELWVYRNGRKVFAGPLMGGQVQGEALSLNAQGLMSYMKYMDVQQDMTFTQVEQHEMVAALINQWQVLEYGNFGIDTTNLIPSGVLRDGTYLKKELADVYKRVTELGDRLNGFDIAVDPTSRKLDLQYPHRGVDRSTGEQAVVFDARNVTSTNIVFSCAPGDVATDAFATGTGNNTDPLYGTASNPELRVRFGRAAVVGQFDGVSEQATLDEKLTGLLSTRGNALLIPGPDTRVTTDSDLSSYDVGDTVSYTLHERLSAPGAFRLKKRQVTAAKTGQESVSVQFV